MKTFLSYTFLLVALINIAFAQSRITNENLGKKINELDDSHMKMAYREMHKFSKRIKKENDVVLYSIGGSFYGGVIREFGMGFKMNRKATLNEARILLVEIVDKFISQIQTNPKIMSNMLGGKIDSSNLSFNILFEDEMGEFYIGEENISFVGCYNGKFDYVYYSPDVKQNKDLLIENYNEAKQIVQNQADQKAKSKIVNAAEDKTRVEK